MNHSLKAFSVAALAAALTACGGGSSSSDDDSTGSMSLDVTDAPTDQFAEVVIEFTGLTLQPADGEAIEFTFDEPKTLDLLTLQGGETAPLLENEEVPAGEYSWIRLTLNVDNSYVTETGGAEKTLFIPSGAETGLKLVSGFTVAQGGSSSFTIDFDARKSIVDPQGAVADYFLRPALRLVNNLEVGSIAGTVDESTVIQTECADSSQYTGMVYVYEGSDATPDDLGSANEPLVAVPVAYDEESTTYSFKAAFLLEGDYTASYSCDTDDNEADEELTFVGTQNVAVVADSEATANFPAE
ncbi:MAG: DUF4382 domain-containing protein [Marinobacter sp.]|uniref:DUF4382 domain-containing protein n=1 Tax=Marinobacter sp. TaxID=50741 RepID=UPI00299D32D3|nr:DUF4382 domain-containing protein [Marinobacter sp.]MDX1756168.1 DUF4382 domain-containing protein [Marinobacter sp.]